VKIGKGLIKGRMVVGKWMQKFEEVRWKMHLNIPRNGNALVGTSAQHSAASGRREQIGRDGGNCSLLYSDLPVMKSTAQPMHRMPGTGEAYLE
jgi:hypothetical protein